MVIVVFVIVTTVVIEKNKPDPWHKNQLAKAVTAGFLFEVHFCRSTRIRTIKKKLKLEPGIGIGISIGIGIGFISLLFPPLGGVAPFPKRENK